MHDYCCVVLRMHHCSSFFSSRSMSALCVSSMFSLHRVALLCGAAVRVRYVCLFVCGMGEGVWLGALLFCRPGLLRAYLTGGTNQLDIKKDLVDRVDSRVNLFVRVGGGCSYQSVRFVDFFMRVVECEV